MVVKVFENSVLILVCVEVSVGVSFYLSERVRVAES